MPAARSFAKPLPLTRGSGSPSPRPRARCPPRPAHPRTAGAAGVRTRFQRDVGGGAARAFAGGLQREDLGMRPPASGASPRRRPRRRARSRNRPSGSAVVYAPRSARRSARAIIAWSVAEKQGPGTGAGDRQNRGPRVVVVGCHLGTRTPGMASLSVPRLHSRFPVPPFPVPALHRFLPRSTFLSNGTTSRRAAATGRRRAGRARASRFLAEIGDVLERAVHRGEAHVADVVELAHLRHHEIADPARRQFAFAAHPHLVHHRADRGLGSFLRHGRLCSARSMLRRSLRAHRSSRAGRRP